LDSTNSDENKHCSSNNPIKQAIRISDKTIVFIDESIVKRLGINEGETWFEEILTENGILLRITRVAPPQ